MLAWDRICLCGRSRRKSELAELGVIVDVNSVQGRIFHSADLGNSWTEITPKDKPALFYSTNGYKAFGCG